MFETEDDFDLDDKLCSKLVNSNDKQNGNKLITKRQNEVNHVPGKNKKFCPNICDNSPLKVPLPSNRERVNSSFARLPNKNDIPKKIVQRKFPGPAGLLPDRRDLNISVESLQSDMKPEKLKNTTDEIICSQVSGNLYQSEAWLQMRSDFQFDTGGNCLPEKYTIQWIKEKASAKKLINQKAPFLAAMVVRVKFFNSKKKTVSVTLKDTTGEIHGTILHDLYEEYADYLTHGSVLILKQFSVLTTGQGSNHYLTITAKNLVTIYSQQIKNSSVFKQLKVVSIQDLTPDDLFKIISEVKAKQDALDAVECFRQQYGFNPTTSNNSIININLNSPKAPVNLPNSFSNTLRNQSSPKPSEPKPKFTFKPKKFSGANNCNQVQLLSDLQTTNQDHLQSSAVNSDAKQSEILQDIFEGLDASVLFDDF